MGKEYTASVYFRFDNEDPVSIACGAQLVEPFPVCERRQIVTYLENRLFTVALHGKRVHRVGVLPV